MVSGAGKVQTAEAATRPSNVTGTYINPAVLNSIHDMHGREILINTTDNKKYSGVLDAVSLNPNSTIETLAFGLRYVVQVTKENEKNLMRTESEVIDKMMFNIRDIVDIAFIMAQEDKHQTLSNKFVTDRKYHGSSPNMDEELQAWIGDDEEIGGSIEDREPVNMQLTNSGRRNNNHHNGNGYWSAHDMFETNKKMNVISTYQEDLGQYSTVEVVGTEEDRERADRLAREIEASQSSRHNANLENDDVERDLDKTTREDDFEYGNNQRRKGNENYNQQQQSQRRNPNLAPNGQPVNRRAEGLKSDRRNSGSSSANNSRYNPPVPQQQQSLQQNYQTHQLQKGGAYNNQNRRQNDSQDYRENDWQMAKGKGQNQGGGHDQSFRQQQKQMLDPRPSAKQTTNSQEPASEKGSSSRVADLKSWGADFNISTSPKEQSPAPPAAAAPHGAWNRGPPSSLVSKGSSTESTPPPPQPDDSAAPPAAASATAASATVAAASSSPKPVDGQKREESPSTSGGEGQDEADGGRKPVDDGGDASNDLSDETSSVITTASKSASFQFNINAPEFKPRVAPTTPTPTTPTGGPIGPGGEMPPPHQQPQFVPTGYQHPGMVQQGGPGGVPMGMVPQGGIVPHMGPAGMAPTQQQLYMWPHQQGQQGYPPNSQFIQQIPMGPGVPGHMYGPAATNPATAQQQQQQVANQQIPTSAAGGAPTDGRQANQQHPRREGEYREPQQAGFYPVTNSGPVMPPAITPQYFQQQYQGGMPQAQFPMKIVSAQQVPQGMYPQRYGQHMYMVAGGPQGQRFQQQQQQAPTHQYGGPEQQHQQQGAPQSHPNSQPTTPGPRPDQNGQKGQGPPQNGMHRETEVGSNASLSGSTSSQSGQRSGSPLQQQQQHGQPQQQQGLPHAHQGPPQVPQQGPPQVPQQGPHGPPAQIVGVPGHMNPQFMMMHPQMPHQLQNAYYQQQHMYYPMMVPQHMQQMQNQHSQQQSVMGERADQGFQQSNIFDFRTLQQYGNQQQQQPQQYQMHQGHMPRQNSIPQQFQGNTNQVLKV